VERLALKWQSKVLELDVALARSPINSAADTYVVQGRSLILLLEK
jgi:hypothetical protein